MEDEYGYYPATTDIKKKKKLSIKEANHFFTNTPPTPVKVVKDHRYPLWIIKHAVVVPRLSVYTEEELARKGIGVTGIKEVDDGSLNVPMQVRISISKMIDIQRSGYDITIRDPEVLIAIYAAIQEYLEIWKETTEGSFVHMTSIPVDDLEALDNFAQDIYNDLIVAEYKLRDKRRGKGGNKFGSSFGSGMSYSQRKERRKGKKEAVKAFFKSTVERKGHLDLFKGRSDRGY